MTGQAVGNRIQKMEDNGIIQAYMIVVDELKVGLSFTAFVIFFMDARTHDDLLKYGNYQLYLSIKEVKKSYNSSLISDE